MHYVPSYQAVPFKLRVRKALREILFIFVPLTLVGLGLMIDRPIHQEATDYWVSGFLLSLLIAPILWFAYRLIRFTIGR